MEGEEHSSPFWLQTTGSRRRQQRSQVSTLFLGSGVFLIALVVIGIFFLLVIIPSFVSFTSQIFRPQHIKRSWDSLNLVLVLFAIICGFLSRSSNSSGNGSTSYYEDRNLSDEQLNVQKPYAATPRTWIEYPQDRPTHSSTLTRLRSFGSYPDLRQESLERWRFYDDTYLNNYRVSSFDQLNHDHPQPRRPQVEEKEEPKKQEDDMVTTDVAVDAFTATEPSASASPAPPPEISSSPPPPPSPPQPARSKVGRRKVKRTYQDPGNEQRIEEERHVETGNFYIPPTSPLPPPSPPPPPPVFRRRRGKDFLASLRRRKKRQRQQSVENIDWLFNPEPESTLSSPPPPPPPLPPPPPQHFFQNIFSSRKSKIKKIHSVPPPPPPPPPLVTSSVSKSASKNDIKPLEGRAIKTNVQVAQAVAHKPSKPITTKGLNNVQKNLYSGNPSPTFPIPPPPPPPPFRIRSWKFVFDGDNVRVGSFNSSRSGSPDLDSLEDAAPDRETSPMAAVKEVGDFIAAPSFCPSPDVNVKADDFIARFRAGLKLEKIDSFKGRSNLGPDASTS